MDSFHLPFFRKRLDEHPVVHNEFIGMGFGNARAYGNGHDEQMKTDLTNALREIQAAAARVETIANLSVAQRLVERQDEAIHAMLPVAQSWFALRAWHRWSGQSLNKLDVDTASMHEVSLMLANKWSQRLVMALLPYRDHFPV